MTKFQFTLVLLFVIFVSSLFTSNLYFIIPSFVLLSVLIQARLQSTIALTNGLYSLQYLMVFTTIGYCFNTLVYNYYLFYSRGLLC